MKELKEILIKQTLYKPIEKYQVLYINESLYEQIFNEKFTWSKSSEKIEEIFSVTTIKTDKELEISGFSDLQTDPLNIALSGNKGSGRAFFINDIFNLKGQKTTLATSSNPVYNNGNFPLPAAIKEAILSNIINNDFPVSSYKTLAILYINKNCIFQDHYLDLDNSIKIKEDIIPCAIQIRVYQNNEMYRISNHLLLNTTINEDLLIENMAKIEAFKYCDRFLHGSWSVGNVSIEGNLLDFDTACFLNNRNPQFSNTNKYKSNYFGFEKLGAEKILEILNLDTVEFNKKYEEYLLYYFCDLIGLDFNNYYFKYKKDIDKLFEKFVDLSKKFNQNICGSYVYEYTNNKTAIYNFSNFFQKYLTLKTGKASDMFLGISLLINDFIDKNENCPKMTEEKVIEFFADSLITDYELILTNAKEFVQLYDAFFNKINITNEILFKQIFINEDKYYIYNKENIYGYLSYCFENKIYSKETINLILNKIITCNYRKISSKNNFALKITEQYLYYLTIENNLFYLTLYSFNKDIDFAKFSFNGKEFYLKHIQNKYILKSEKIPFTPSDLIDANIAVLVNGNYIN